MNPRFPSCACSGYFFSGGAYEMMEIITKKEILTNDLSSSFSYEMNADAATPRLCMESRIGIFD